MLAYRRKRRIKKVAQIMSAFAGAAILGGAAALVTDRVEVQPTSRAAEAKHYGEILAGCSVTDGDTIRCGNERIRLLGIDAPEMPGHCRQGRDCVEGDPYASTASLAAGMIGSLSIERVGEDHYGRTLAVVAGSQGDLSCWQLRHEQAVYKAKWDDGLRVVRACPGAAF
jgi:hypothetical protein